MRDKKEINIYIGNQIRIARERAGLTQAQFGEIVSLGTKNVSDIERGVAGITVSTLKGSVKNCLFPAIQSFLEVRAKMMLRILPVGWNACHRNSFQP